jgi:Flp pilus assembly protein TadG
MGVFARLSRFRKRDTGVITLEMALVVPLFVIFVLGVIEFGHLWYVKHNLTIASREGARYGTQHPWPKPTGWTPATLNPSIREVVEGYLGSDFVAYYGVQVIPQGSGCSTGNTGEDVTVVVTANQNLSFALGYLVPGLKNLTVGAATTMRIE